jgi:anti-anti-sigma regulatory factor
MSRTTTIKLTGSVGVAQVGALRDTAREALLAGEAVVFDCGELRDVDASILQLMFATRGAAAEQQLSMDLAGVSDALAKSIENYGASAVLTPSESLRPTPESALN